MANPKILCHFDNESTFTPTPVSFMRNCSDYNARDEAHFTQRKEKCIINVSVVAQSEEDYVMTAPGLKEPLNYRTNHNRFNPLLSAG